MTRRLSYPPQFTEPEIIVEKHIRFVKVIEELVMSVDDQGGPRRSGRSMCGDKTPQSLDPATALS